MARDTTRTTGPGCENKPLRDDTIRKGDRNEDPLTGEPGAHPVGAGLGAAAGGAATGAAAGAVAGPVGAAAGIVAGGLIGREIAEGIDPTAEEQYWRNEYPARDYYHDDVSYEAIGPAYQYGWESRAKYPDRPWDEVEPDLAREWRVRRGSSPLEWEQARPATRDAWDRIDMIVVEEVDDDTGQAKAAENRQEPSARRPK